MKTILLGGLAAPLREQVPHVFSAHRTEYRVVQVASSERLLDLVKAREGDLLVLDLDASQGDRLDWLARLAECRADLPVVALGEAPRPDVSAYEARYPNRHFPQVSYLQKPVTPQAVLEAAVAEFLEGTWGVIQGLSLSTFLQMLGMEAKTCTLRITSGRRQGFLYLQAGQVLNARFRRLEGLEAALLLLNSPAVKIEIDPHLHDFRACISLRTEELLMMAAQVLDEQGENFLEDTAIPDETDHVPPSEVGRWAADRVPPPPRVSVLRRWRWAFLVVAGGTAAALAWGLIPRRSTVALVSIPTGARVFLDGADRGRTPISLDVDHPPRGHLKLDLPGHLPHEQALQSDDRSLTIRLQKRPQEHVAAPPAVVEPPESPSVAKPNSAKRVAPPKAATQPKSDIFDQVRGR